MWNNILPTNYFVHKNSLFWKYVMSCLQNFFYFKGDMSNLLNSYICVQKYICRMYIVIHKNMLLMILLGLLYDHISFFCLICVYIVASHFWPNHYQTAYYTYIIARFIQVNLNKQETSSWIIACMGGIYTQHVAASILLKMFSNGYKRCHNTDAMFCTIGSLSFQTESSQNP